MFVRSSGLYVGLVLCFCATPLAGQETREPWQQPYQRDDAKGKHVIGYWTFDSADPMADASGHGLNGKLEGAKIVPDGRFGSSLQSSCGWPVTDKRHRMLVADHPTLSPKGPFAIELWINADKALDGYPDSFLIDKKYVADTDYQLMLQRAQSGAIRSLKATLGFGGMSASWYSDPLEVETGKWYHIAFVYDGAGTGRFFVNGRLWGEKHIEGVLSIQGGSHPLSIGDRVGSYFHGFPGRIDSVRITKGVREFRPVRIERMSDRTCFLRMEKQAAVRLRVVNLQRTILNGATLTWSVDGLPGKSIELADLKAGESREVRYLLDTALRPDTYQLLAKLECHGERALTVEKGFELTIVPRRTPNRFPVVMWGAGLSEIERLKQIGFTHSLGIGADYGRIWDAGKAVPPADEEKVRAVRESLDKALVEGVSFAASLSPGSYLRKDKRFLRVDRAGKSLSKRPDICGLFPEIGPFCYNVGRSVAAAYGDLPAFNAALLHTEVRDAARPCFHPHDLAAFRKAAGIDVPAEVVNRTGVRYQKLSDFPKDRVIPDDHPLYVYYKWYWKQGDGWNGLNTQLQRGLDTMDRSDFWTWHDPAVRVASVYGSGGDVNFISQWTYSYPDPIRIGVATDELLAMARGAKTHQQVMKMTQVIWYRSQTAPEPKKPGQGPDYKARWERQQPDAPFITIAPMHLREAFWTKIARPIKGIMYHGWQSLVPSERVYSYRCTNTQTARELQRLVRTVVKPLGPSLRNIPGIKSDIAYYESFSSQMFAGRGTYGWGGKWSGDAYQMVMWAGLQPDIVFDETIIGHGLDQFKILFMMNCDVLTQSVARRIQQFQARGGLVIGDENTAPAIRPDIVLPIYNRNGNALKDKAALQDIAEQLRKALEDRYERYVDSDNPDVIVHRRRSEETDYIFVINDHRQYGRYVGQHGRVMEDGLPSKAVVTLARPRVVVYDLVRHTRVPTRQTGNASVIDLELGPCEGRMLMVTPQAIAGVQLVSPLELDRGKHGTVTARVVDSDVNTIRGVVPVHVAIEDTEAREVEYSGYWAAVNGQVVIPLDIASNEPAGTWTIRVRELASGQSAQAFMRIRGPAIGQPASPLGKDAGNPVQPKG